MTPPAGGRRHYWIFFLTSIEKCELFFCWFCHGDIHWPIFDILHNTHVSAITHLIERGKKGKEERTEEAFYSLARMNTEDSLVAKRQKPSGFNSKGERADLFLGHKMSKRIQRKAGFLTLGTGQNKKPLALSPSLIPYKNFIFLLLFKLVPFPLWSTWWWTTLSPKNQTNVEGLTHAQDLDKCFDWSSWS